MGERGVLQGLKELDTIERLNDTNNKENQTNEGDAKEKQTHRPRKQTDDYQTEEGKQRDRLDTQIKKYLYTICKHQGYTV